MIQLKWSDEDVWKDFAPAEPDTDLQIKRLQADWAAAKKKYRLGYDAEFRVNYRHLRLRLMTGQSI